MKSLSVVFSVISLGALVSMPAHAEYTGPAIKFRLAHTAPPGNHITLAYKQFGDLVEKKSDGKIKVQIFPGAVLGSDRVLVEAMLST